MSRRFRLAVLLALASGTALTAGQSPSSAPSQIPPPTFRLEVEYVEVDALVTDGQGEFVRDLTADDFQIFEDGEPQEIASFTLVDIPVERPEQPLYASAPIEPDIKTNERPFNGRVYVMILDDLHTDTLRSQRVRVAARQFIERNLGANDLMAVVHSGGRAAAAQDFTGNRRLLLASVDQFMGRKVEPATVSRSEQYYRNRSVGGSDQWDPFDHERRANAQATLGSLRKISEWFGGIRGRRKTILFFSEGIDYDIYDAFNSSASSVLTDTREAIAAATRGNVSIYAIDPRGLTGLGDVDIAVDGYADQDRVQSELGGDDPSTRPDRAPDFGLRSLASELRLSQDSLRMLAEETNGLATINANDFASAFERIVEDSSSYYVLAYYPPSNRRDGKLHRISVRVSRPGLTVRARQAYAAPRGDPRTPTARNDGASPPVLEALNNPLPVSGLTMRVFAASFKGAAPNASVLVGTELRGADLTLEADNRVEWSFFAVDAAGKNRGGRTENVTLNLRPETKEVVARSGLRVLSRLDLPAGRYQLRVAAYDAGGGAVGALSYDLEVPDYDKLPFSMSSLALTSMLGSSIPTVRIDEQLQAVLPAPPVGLRTFPQNDEIALFAEIYDQPGDAPHSVDITTTVRADDGRILFKLQDERSSAELEGQRGGYGYTARVPLNELPPGWYVLTVEAQSRVGPSARREIEFAVVPGPQPQ